MKFVYIRSQRGPQPQMWPDDMPINDKNSFGEKVLHSIKLKRGEEELSLAELEKRYPYHV